mmetsp:Transcript_34355/g.81429  ORF Transcript_34355/g.81429 Transcript_34355/m.81429 type:complete len:257 (-) Transcript_34355:569-1339(-)
MPIAPNPSLPSNPQCVCPIPATCARKGPARAPGAALASQGGSSREPPRRAPRRRLHSGAPAGRLPVPADQHGAHGAQRPPRRLCRRRRRPPREPLQLAPVGAQRPRGHRLRIGLRVLLLHRIRLRVHAGRGDEAAPPRPPAGDHRLTRRRHRDVRRCVACRHGARPGLVAGPAGAHVGCLLDPRDAGYEPCRCNRKHFLANGNSPMLAPGATTNTFPHGERWAHTVFFRFDRPKIADPSVQHPHHRRGRCCARSSR